MRYAYEPSDLEFQDVVNRIVAAHDWNSFLSVAEDSGSAPLPISLWKQLQEIGLRGLTVSEEINGAGAEWTTMAAAIEALGAAAVPVPLLPQIAVIEALLDPAAGLAAGERAQLAELYLGSDSADKRGRSVRADSSEAALQPAAALRVGSFDPSDCRMEITRRTGSGYTVTGSIRGIVHPKDACRLVAPARREGRLELVLVDAHRSLVETASLDHSRPLADLTLEAAPILMTLATDEAAATAWRYAMRWVEILVAVENIGVARSALNRSAEYATQRRQFGAPLSDNQAIRHALADGFIAVYESDAVVHEALRVQSQLDDGAALEEIAEAELTASLAVIASTRAATEVTERMVQVHGGVGFTWDSDVHILLKRAIGNRLLVGAPHEHRAKVARLVDV